MKKLMNKQLTRSLSALCSGVMVMATVLASADTYTWSTNTVGAAADGAGTWDTTTANWVGAGDVHTTWNNANGDTAAFGNGGAAGSVTLSSGITIGGLLFNTGITGAYTLAGGPLNIINAPVFDVGTNATISAVIQGVPGFTKTGNGTLTLSAANTFTGDVAVLNGVLISTSSANNPNPVATGLGNMTLVGRTTTVSSGAKLVLDGSDALGMYTYKTPMKLIVDGGTLANGATRFMSIGDIELKNGAQWEVNNGAASSYQAFNLRGGITVSGTSGSAIVRKGTTLDGLHLGGSTIPGTCFDVGDTGDPVADLIVTTPLLNEVNRSTGSLIKTGAGKMILAADNSFSGGTTISNGILQIGNGVATGTVGFGPVKLETAGASLIFNRSGTVNVPGEVSGSGSLQHLGSGVVTLSGGNTYTGTTTVSNGILAISGLLSGYDTPGMITVGPGAGLTVDPLLWNIGALASLLGNASFAPNSLFGANTLSGNDEISDSLALPYSMGFVKTGPNVLTLSGNNSYAGGTFVMGGILHADFGAGISATTNVTLNNSSFSPITTPFTAALGTGAGQVNIVAGTASGFSAVNTPLTVNLGGAGDTLSWGSAPFNPSIFVLNDFGANTNLTLANGINLNAGSRMLTVNAAQATVSGVISGTAALVKGGTGSLVLNNENTYTGDTTLNAGTLMLAGGNNRLNSASKVTVNPGTVLDLGGYSQSLNNLKFIFNGGILQNGVMDIGGADVAPGANVTIGSGGGIVNSRRLLLQGGQTMTLAPGAGAVCFAGNDGSAANFIGVDNANANTVIVNGGSLNFTNMAAGAGYLRIGAGNNASTKGSLTLNNGAVNIGHSMNMGANYANGNAQAKGEGVLTINGGEVNVGTGISITGAGGNRGWFYLGNNYASTVSRSTINLNGGILSLIQLEAGAFGSNQINFNGGTLQARANNQSLINGANLVCNLGTGGAAIDTDGFSVGINSALSGVGCLTKRGAGALALSGVNTFSGGIQVEEGSLKLGHPMGAPNLRLHLDASDTSTLAQSANGTGAVTTTGDPVGSWGDLSPSGLPATQSLAARRPTYIASVPEFNNMPVLQFDGIDDDITALLNINASNIPDMTIIMVYKQLEKTGNAALWGHDNGGFDRLQLFYNSGNFYQVAGNNAGVPVKGMETNKVTLYTAVLRNGVANGSFVYINGSSNTSTGLIAFTSQENSPYGREEITFGNINAGNTSFFGKVQIGEALVFDTALSDSARRNVENQLRNKWLGADEPVPLPVLAAANPPRMASKSVSGLKLHLDASDSTTLFENSSATIAVTNSGQSVAYWGDLSLSALHALQGTAVKQPVYVANVAEFNGLPVVEFDGVNDSMASLLNINKSVMPNMTMMMIYRKLSPRVSGGLWGHDNGGWDRLQLLDFQGVGNNNIAANNVSLPVKGMNTISVLIYTASLRNGVADGSSVYINGIADNTMGLPVFTSSEDVGQASLTLASIGEGASLFGNIQIGEVLVFDRTLSEAERGGFEDYLRGKWLGGGSSDSITIASGATLDLDQSEVTLTLVEGAGTVSNGTLNVTSSISPAGSSIGTLHVANAALSGTLLIDVAADGSSDLLSVTGSLALNGLTLQVKDTVLLDSTKSYEIIESVGTLTGSFAATNLENSWKVCYDRSKGTATIRWVPDGTLLMVR